MDTLRQRCKPLMPRREGGRERYIKTGRGYVMNEKVREIGATRVLAPSSGNLQAQGLKVVQAEHT